jgi:acyl-CoA thioester hydrolase
MAFEFPIRVYWEDTDAGGIVFYANYLKFFERARTEWLRSLGISQQKLRDETGGIFVVSETQLKFLGPARLDDELLVTASLLAAGRVSMTISQQVLKAGAVLCEGSIRIGWVNAIRMQPERIPLTVLDVLK